MNMELGPILKTLYRNKVSSLLIVLQIAIAMAVISNSLSIVKERAYFYTRDSGVELEKVFFIRLYGLEKALDTNNKQTLLDTREMIRNVPGVEIAELINTPPLNGSGSYSRYKPEGADPESEEVSIALYYTTDAALEAMDVEIIAGKGFSHDELIYVDSSTSSSLREYDGLFTQASLASLWPDVPYQDLIGKQVVATNGIIVTVRGVIKTLHAQYPTWDGIERTAVFPILYLLPGRPQEYVINVGDNDIDEVMDRVYQAATTYNPNQAVSEMRKMKDIYAKAYREHIGLVKTLLITVVMMSVITGLGIVGLTNYSVSRRRKQLGTRRALGATKWDIARYLIMENLSLVIMGVILGSGLTIGLNIFLVEQFAVGKISLIYIPMSILIITLTGLLSILWPAVRGASVSPAVATRSV